MIKLTPRSPRTSHLIGSTINHDLVAQVLAIKRRAMMDSGFRRETQQ